jgi:hypothetical protein
MKLWICLALLLIAPVSRAAAVVGHFTALGSDQWQVEFSVSHTGDPTPIAEFTVYFSEQHFADVVVVASPAGWDTIAIEPDTTIPAPGFVDGLALSAADHIVPLQTLDGFLATFRLLGASQPFDLRFDVYGEGLDHIGSGEITAIIDEPDMPLPEPPAPVLLMLAGAVAAASRRARPVRGVAA